MILLTTFRIGLVMMIKKLILVLRNLDVAYNSIRNIQRMYEVDQERLNLLRSYNVIGFCDNPIKNIGSALSVAKKYNIEIVEGRSSKTVIAFYPHYLFPEGLHYNSFFPNDTNTHNDCHVERLTVQEAVCDCLITCLEVGIIKL